MTGFSSTSNVIGIMGEVINRLSQICQPTAVSAENLKSNPSSNADAYSLISGGEVHSIVVARGGAGYLSAPAVTFVGGGQGSGESSATATAVLTNGVVTSITITDGGSGYTEPPQVVIVDSPDSTTITGNGTIKTFAGGLAFIPISPGSVSIADADSVETFTDNDGNGKLSSTLGGSGTINYQTGAVSLIFSTAPGNTKNIVSTYTYGRYSNFKVARNTNAFGGQNIEINIVDNFTSLPYKFTGNFMRQDVAGSKS